MDCKTTGSLLHQTTMLMNVGLEDSNLLIESGHHLRKFQEMLVETKMYKEHM